MSSPRGSQVQAARAQLALDRKLGRRPSPRVLQLAHRTLGPDDAGAPAVGDAARVDRDGDTGLGRRDTHLLGVARLFGVVAAPPAIVFLLILPSWIEQDSPVVWMALLIGVPLLFVPLAWTIEALIRLVVLLCGALSRRPEDRTEVTGEVIAFWMPGEGRSRYLAETQRVTESLGDQADAHRRYRKELRRTAVTSIIRTWREVPAVLRLSRWWTAGAPAVVAALAALTALVLHLDGRVELAPALALTVFIVSSLISLVAHVWSKTVAGRLRH